MTPLDLPGLVLTVVATIGMLAWCLELERRAAASPPQGDDPYAGLTYLVGCECWIALDVTPALALRRGRAPALAPHGEDA